MNQLFDPLRRADVAATPEESVRQWIITELIGSFGIPATLMMSEVAFTYGGKRYRADVLIYDRNAQPLAIVECKRPDVQIDGKVVEQAMRYNAVLSVRYIILTNGNKTFVFQRQNTIFVPMDHIPVFQEMLCQQ